MVLKKSSVVRFDTSTKESPPKRSHDETLEGDDHDDNETRSTRRFRETRTDDDNNSAVVSLSSVSCSKTVASEDGQDARIDNDDDDEEEDKKKESMTVEFAIKGDSSFPSQTGLSLLFSDNQQPEDLVDHVLSFCSNSCLRTLRGVNGRLRGVAERRLDHQSPLQNATPLPDRTHGTAGEPRLPVVYYQDVEQEVRLQWGWSIPDKETLINRMVAEWEFLQPGFLPEGVVLRYPRLQAVKQLREFQECDIHRSRYSGMKAQISLVGQNVEEEEERNLPKSRLRGRRKKKGTRKNKKQPEAKVEEAQYPPTISSLREVMDKVTNGFFRLDGSLPRSEHARLRNDVFNLFVLDPCRSGMRFATAECEYRSSNHGIIARRRLVSIMFRTKDGEKAELWSYRSSFCFGARRFGRSPIGVAGQDLNEQRPDQPQA